MYEFSFLSFRVLHSLHPSPLSVLLIHVTENGCTEKSTLHEADRSWKGTRMGVVKIYFRSSSHEVCPSPPIEINRDANFSYLFSLYFISFLYSKLNCNTYFVPLYGAVIQPPYLYLGKHFFLLSSAPLTFPLSFLLSPSWISYYQEINSFFSSPRVHVWRKFVPGPKFRR